MPAAQSRQQPREPIPAAPAHIAAKASTGWAGCRRPAAESTESASPSPGSTLSALRIQIHGERPSKSRFHRSPEGNPKKPEWRTLQKVRMKHTEKKRSTRGDSKLRASGKRHRPWDNGNTRFRKLSPISTQMQAQKPQPCTCGKQQQTALYPSWFPHSPGKNAVLRKKEPSTKGNKYSQDFYASILYSISYTNSSIFSQNCFFCQY